VTVLPTPERWLDPGWRADARAWAQAALDRDGLTVSDVTQPHVRPWSTVLRVETPREPFWLKANGDGTRHEARVLALLAELDVPRTPRPIAVDTERGWTLLPDGGPTLREAFDGTPTLDATAEMFAAYSGVQRATEPHIAAFIAAGVDDVRPHRMPELLAGMIDELATAPTPHGIDTGTAARLHALVPAYARACDELAAGPVPATLQHDDLHSNNVFARDNVVFDWGDSVVGHPFGTMLASLNSVAHHLGLARDDAALALLVDAYIEAWTDVCDRATLRRLVSLAVRVGPLTRVLAWRRALDGVDDDARAEWGDAPAGWLTELESTDLPLRPPLLA
jgi:hypothetical protein